MWGQRLEFESPEVSLKSESPEGQSSEVQSHGVTECQVSRDFKSASPRSSPQITFKKNCNSRFPLILL